MKLKRIKEQKCYTDSYFISLRDTANLTLALERKDFKSEERIVMTFFAVRNWIRKINFADLDRSTFIKALSVVVKRHGEIKTCKSLKLDYKR